MRNDESELQTWGRQRSLGSSPFWDGSIERAVQTDDFEDSTFCCVVSRNPFVPQALRKFKRFHRNVEIVWAAMLQHSKNWEWSSESSQFIEQFRTRYPVEFQKIEQELSLEDHLKNASLPLKEIAKKLRDFARGELEIPSDASHAPGRSIVLPSQL